MLLREENNGNLHGIKIGRLAPVISHLLFADDLLLFSKAHIRDAAVMDRCLLKCMAWSGQKINRSMSSIHFSKKISGSDAIPICDLLCLKRMLAKAKHLGMPLLFPRSKYHALADLKERIFSRLAG